MVIKKVKIETTNMRSHLQRKLLASDCEYHAEDYSEDKLTEFYDTTNL